MDEELDAKSPEHEPVPAEAAREVAGRAAAGITPSQMPTVYLGHGAPPLVDDPLWVVQLEAWAQATEPPGWSTEFDHWAAEALDHGDVSALADFRRAPGAKYAHPTTEHFAPLFVTLGAAEGSQPVTTITGYWLGLAKRSFQVA